MSNSVPLQRLNRQPLVRLISVIALTVLIALSIGHWWPAAAADSGFPITETFVNAQPGAGWKLGGHITLDSEPELGAVFTVWLPIAPQP